MFKLKSSFKPQGDQIEAIKKLVNFIKNKKGTQQVLLGATGTGKTFTMANVIQQVQKSTLIIVHNKTLAMQIYQEMQNFFPNKVNVWISVFEKYQPEAYIADKNLYIGKKTKRNNSIEKLRSKTLNDLVSNEHVIVVASVAAIYGCFNPFSYKKVIINISKGDFFDENKIRKDMINLGYREKKELEINNFLINKNSFSFMFNWEDKYYILVFFDDKKVIKIEKRDKENQSLIREINNISIPPSQNYVSEDEKSLRNIIKEIKNDLNLRKEELIKENKILEFQRLKKRVQEDLLNLRETGICPGIENYSRYFDNRKINEPPFTIMDYFPSDFLVIIDESHNTIPQIKGMYNTSRNRIKTLIDNGFRLPSALDNRPLNQEEFFDKIKNVIYVSATPGEFEMIKSNYEIVEQIIRPTGLLDPLIEIRNLKNSIKDIIKEIKIRVKKNEKVLIYSLTIMISEDIANYLQERNIKVVYLHSKLDVFDRYQAITNLRRGIYDVIVGINLLKEGIDLPEVSLVCILDADKSGFLRDYRSLIQIIGRATRNKNGKVILYADNVTKDINLAIEETNRRRRIQIEYNKNNKIEPKSIEKPIKDISLDSEISSLVEKANRGEMKKKELKKFLKSLKNKMKISANKFDFGLAISYRNAIFDIEKLVVKKPC